MTRFARAKGSKASNERAPGDGTPWEVMKEQLAQTKKENEESKKRHEAENQRLQNYENFLKERKVQKRTTTWCDFPVEAEVPPKKKLATSDADKLNAKNVKNVSKQTTNTPNEDKGKSKSVEVVNKSTGDVNADTNKPTGKKAKKKKCKLNSSSLNAGESQNPKTNVDTTANENNIIVNDATLPLPESTSAVPQKKKKKQNKNAPQTTDTQQNKITTQGQPFSNINDNKNNAKKKKMKSADGKPVRRKPVDDHSFQLIINGKDVELVRFDGFPIMKKDAERLKELKDSMIKKGIPKSEVQRTMKLERRRAEKALARLKRDVCYNCRKGGHNLSDCPELKSKIPGADAPEGICFKCGSTEHRSFECKVQKDQGFRFATCFICKQQGHIARQCPDNPKGLYPNGGACKICGDVTHLRKDCPSTQDKRVESSMRLETLDTEDNVESFAKNNLTVQKKANKPKKIKF